MPPSEIDGFFAERAMAAFQPSRRRRASSACFRQAVSCGDGGCSATGGSGVSDAIERGLGFAAARDEVDGAVGAESQIGDVEWPAF